MCCQRFKIAHDGIPRHLPRFFHGGSSAAIMMAPLVTAGLSLQNKAVAQERTAELSGSMIASRAVIFAPAPSDTQPLRTPLCRPALATMAVPALSGSFDPETIASKPREPVYDMPDGSVRVKREAVGIDYVLVNGEVRAYIFPHRTRKRDPIGHTLPVCAGLIHCTPLHGYEPNARSPRAALGHVLEERGSARSRLACTIID